MGLRAGGVLLLYLLDGCCMVVFVLFIRLFTYDFFVCMHATNEYIHPTNEYICMYNAQNSFLFKAIVLVS